MLEVKYAGAQKRMRSLPSNSSRKGGRIAQEHVQHIILIPEAEVNFPMRISLLSRVTLRNVHRRSQACAWGKAFNQEASCASSSEGSRGIPFRAFKKARKSQHDSPVLE